MNAGLKFRGWQEDCFARLNDHLRGCLERDAEMRFNIEACVGAGKSLAIAETVRRLVMGETAH